MMRFFGEILFVGYLILLIVMINSRSSLRRIFQHIKTTVFGQDL